MQNDHPMPNYDMVAGWIKEGGVKCERCPLPLVKVTVEGEKLLIDAAGCEMCVDIVGDQFGACLKALEKVKQELRDALG